jgi:hypothetical protein
LRASLATVRAVNLLLITAQIILGLYLGAPLSVALHEHRDRPELLHAFFLSSEELLDEKVFPEKHSLLLNDIVELTFLLLNNVFLIIVFIVIVVVLLVVKVLLLLVGLLSLQLVEDVLDLPLELLIALLHKVLQDLRHPKLLGFLPQPASREDGIKRAVNVSTHLQIVVLN